MRIRTIKPEFWLDENLAALPLIDRLTFIGLWGLADRNGRMEDRPARIKAALFPYDNDIDIDEVVDRLDEAQFVHRYEVDGDRYLAIPGFEKHQRPHPKEQASDVPPPPSREKARPSREIKRQAVERFSTIPSSPAGKGREGKEILDNGKEISAPAQEPVAASDPPKDGEPPPSKKKPKPQKEPDPRHRPLQQALEAEFESQRGAPYGFTPADAAHVATLLRMGGSEESLRRWRTALAHQGFPQVSTLGELVKNWNHFAPKRQEAGRPRRIDIEKTDPGAWTQEGLDAQLREIEHRINGTASNAGAVFPPEVAHG